MNIRFTQEYGDYLRSLGWFSESIGNKKTKLYLFGKKLPLVGSYLRFVTPDQDFPLSEVEYQAKKNRAFKIVIASTMVQTGGEEKLSLTLADKGYRYTDNTLLPTKTILIDLRSLDEVWKEFTSAKRRAIRAAEKRGVKIWEAQDEKEFIRLKESQLRPFGFLLKKETRNLWKIFYQKRKAEIILAGNDSKKVLGGVFLLFHDKIAYYWMASSTKEGKTNYAPSLLVWEALKLAKKRECKVFDFEGIEDERFKETKSWRGFTLFKRGFGGKIIYRFRPIQKMFWPTL